MALPCLLPRPSLTSLWPADVPNLSSQTSAGNWPSQCCTCMPDVEAASVTATAVLLTLLQHGHHSPALGDSGLMWLACALLAC